MASDAHNGNSRPFGLYGAYQLIDKHLGEETADCFRKNAQNIVSNIPIEKRLVERSGKKRHNFFGLFSRKD
ncbi:hypothetical protein [Paenibacillus forsythiae]|uniref:hypothetical protein n=1 Tax=Paenibacillus forsythiae TaxID=365616 RepID=UPI001E381C23|nr:hypothetical protein [Paenibacillus forsythiae]